MFAPVQNETSLRSIFMLLFVWFIRSSFRFSLKLFAWMFCQVNLLETGQYGDEDFNRKDFSSSYGHGGWIFHLENLCKIKDIFILYARFKLLYNILFLFKQNKNYIKVCVAISMGNFSYDQLSVMIYLHLPIYWSTRFIQHYTKIPKEQQKRELTCHQRHVNTAILKLPYRVEALYWFIEHL